ncbi:hypothetical protein ONE63_010962 [Megalurothrips usitatus]|uniref:Cyclic nucleotide-binding domain-containing protein n=1 Tax=Megalurothrips usitatus TaxID=439358 RepID=A0AAV7XI48_9NEOP|nr:hypothetical protein ONE63_010962 [Megalurothrips usitatus]
MKLRTTVQLSGAITSTIQKTKPPLKREDSFLKRFSTRQIAEAQTVDTGDDGEGGSCSSSGGGRSEACRRRRRRRRQQRLSRTVVNPDENFYFYWLMLLTVCVLYNVWTLIVRQSFPELQDMATGLWFTADGFSDIVFLLDVVVQFRTGYLEQGLMVYDSSKLAGHYMQSRAFLLDLGSLLPLDLLQFNVGINPILRFPRFLKAYRVYHYYYMVESRTVYPNLWRVVNLIHILLVLAHWFGCFYFLLSQHEKFQGDWVYPYRPGEYSTLTRKYLGSLYWSTLTLTTIGDLPTPETNADLRKSFSDGPQNMRRRGHKSRLLQFSTNTGYIFTIISYLIGVFIFATIVGQVGNVITNRNANRLEFERLLDGAKTYMRHHKVPGGMKRRVLRWYDYSWSRGRIQGGGDINTALGLLPDKLKTELALHVNLSVLKKVTIFQECQPEFLHDLVLKMKAYIFTPGDLICRKGEVAREMFIIADGILEVISETGRVLTTMKAGDFFGEIGILNLDGLNKRTADVRSVGYSELFSLSREDVLAAMKDYPEAQEILQSLGRKRLMEARHVSRTKDPGRHHQSGPQSQPRSPVETQPDARSKRIVERIRSDVKQGLKNALRKGRRGTNKMEDESMELQPLTKGGPGSKGVLRRMPRVRSDEFSAEDSSEEPTAPTEKIGEGLPLIQRLLMLKAKQDQESVGASHHSGGGGGAGGGGGSGAGGGGGAAPTAREEQREAEGQVLAKLRNLKTTRQQQHDEAGEGRDDSPPREVIGAGLPLLQRLLLLKAKEDRERLAAERAALGSEAPAPPAAPGGRRRTRGSSISKALPAAEVLPSAAPSSGDSDEGQTSTTKKSSILKRIVSIKKKPGESVTASISTVTPSASSGTIKGHASVNTSFGSDDAGDERSPGKQDEQAAAPAPLPAPPSKGSTFKEKLKTVLHTSTASATSTVTNTASRSKQTWGLLRKATVSSKGKGRTSSSSSTSTAAPDVTAAATTMASVTTTPAAALAPTPAPAPTPVISTTSLLARRVTSPPTLKPLGLAGPCLSNVGEEEEDAVTSPTPNSAAESTATTISVAVPTAAAPAATAVATSSSPTPVTKKPNLLRFHPGSKLYKSIDDLSPEYCGLPFVKRLKILNERQKLAELEANVRSTSLDSGGVDDDEPQCLTRSHSETCAMEHARARHRQRSQDVALARPTDLSASGAPLPPPVLGIASPESNETVERRHLKSILKKLSSSSLFDPQGPPAAPTAATTSAPGTPASTSAPTAAASSATASTPPPAVPTADIKRLMRAPTIEGYAARHSKLAKSVTFNRDTLQSPPPSATTPTLPATTASAPASATPPKTTATAFFPSPDRTGTAKKVQSSCDSPAQSEAAAATMVSCDRPRSPPPPASTAPAAEASTAAVPAAPDHITVVSAAVVSVSSPARTQVLISSSVVTQAAQPGAALALPFPIPGMPPLAVAEATSPLDALPPLPASRSESESEGEDGAQPDPVTLTTATTTVTVAPSAAPAPAPAPTPPSQSPSPAPSIPRPPTTAPAPPLDGDLHPRKKVPFIVQESKPMPTNQKNFFRPETFLRTYREEEYFSDILVGIKQVIQGHMDDLQRGFQSQCHSLELEVKKRDDIIAKLQHRIQELERGDSVDTVLFSPPRSPTAEDHEEAEDEDDEDDDDEVDVVVRPRHRGGDDEDDDSNANVCGGSRRSSRASDHHPDTETSTDEGDADNQRSASGNSRRTSRQLLYRRSWEDHSEEEHMELQDLPPSMSPQAVWSNVNGGKPVQDSVVLNIGTSDASSNEEDEFEDEADLYPREDDDDDELQFRGHQGDWEVQMLARELERREEQHRLQEEVRVLEQAVNDNTCTLDDLSNSQLDLLERMLTSGTALRRATAPAHYPALAAAPHPAAAATAAQLRLRRGTSLEETEATAPRAVHGVPMLPSTSASALHRRRSYRQHSLASRSNGSQGGVGRPGVGAGAVGVRNDGLSLVSTEAVVNRVGDVASPGSPGSARSPALSQGGRPSPRKQQLLNARSLEEHREPGPGSSVLHRLTSRSTSQLAHSSFPSSLVRGIGQLVRGHAPSTAVAPAALPANPVPVPAADAAILHHHHHHHFQVQEAAPVTPPSCAAPSTTPSGAAVATISQGILAPPPPPPPPPPDL